MIPFGLQVEGARMRGSDARSGSLFSYVDMEERVPAKHPLRTIKAIVDDVLVSLDAEFERLYEGTGRQSIAPERLLRASLLQAFYSVRSERQLMEQIDYNLLFRWFVGLGIDDAVWDHSTFSKNRDRLLDADVAAKFLEAVLRHPQGEALPVGRPLLGRRHAGGGLGFAQELPRQGRQRRAAGARAATASAISTAKKRANDTHESTTDPDAKLYRKGTSQPAKLYFMGHALIENRHGLVVQADATQATGKAERGAALAMIDRQDPGSERRLTLAADKGYDTSDFVADLQAEVRHAARCSEGEAARRIDGRTTRHDELSR